jgi:uncharacterized phiE125 gp8 family phage protein
MRTALQLVLGPTEEPVSLDEAKAHLRVDLDADDDRIEDAITAARETLEIEMRRCFLTTTWTLGLEHFPWCGARLRLPRPPLRSVDAITYLDVDGAAQTLSTEVYGVDTLSEPGRLYLNPAQVWPGTYGVPNAVQITFVAGWDDVLYVPAGIKHAIKLLVGHMYEHREETAEHPLTEIPLGVKRLIWLFRHLEAV